MDNNVSVNLIQQNKLELLKKQVFDVLDVSEGTRKEYSVRIRHFMKFTEVYGINCNTYLEYKRFLGNIDTFSVATKNKYLIASKVFLNGLYRLQLIPVKITDNIKGFSQSKLHKKDGLNDEAILKLQNYCSTLELTETNLRLKSILALLIFQGLRQIEIVRLNVTDIDLKNKTAYIIGKGRDDKEVIHLHPTTVKMLREYLKKYRYREGALFRSKSNNSCGERLTTKSIREIIKQVFKTLEIDGSTHGFRHFFITKLIKSYKGELLTVSKYSRHRSIQMLEVYNDEVIREQDLPRYYNVFNDITL
ncbi:integrase [Parabacteroides sp. PF5-5]|uniref:tyrosine-type recombinase/integrase n=1 Tax=unclassified Parabacteroides TaxID=2649774 RepID=UPI002475C6E0|nr:MULTISPECIES: tyrosine-type recombinase/integrase [unclassified Parabacteroides]MDH6306696.1 integrase [Parabacteroides sp. PH5-39]MDH6316227.1 integrase [Parabacteroides sp. PF5-13]MDH6321452.1 integrase [Parabacteroides sp. PH5-13]MDH6325183.1 integrase [Parabacteroides sp. PH5-8]MDH6329059.1 integrase [Parabacteroides sp. PH5-41]